ncbi:MAG TPA: FtsX-like permease family protein, partial [Ktedonobacteraceae bacterium]|nr:FtsX-like permease family protein [Ktedonobacteraceae bacterium]
PVQHLVLAANAPPVVYSMSIPALQLLVGVAPEQESILRSYLSEGSNITSPARLTIHVDRLNGQLTMLSSCAAQAAKSTCWQPVTAQTGHITYLAQDVQLLRYSQGRYSATMQQLSQGQLTLDALGEDTQGNIYRDLLQQHLTLPGDAIADSAMGTGQQTEVLPLTGPQHMPMLPGAPQFLPLAQACVVNGEQCYSGLYIRLRGVDQYNSKSLALLQSTAAAITARTGLHVDILDGSSTRRVTLASGNANNALTTTWRVAGVAVQITHGVDALQNTLFILCALICLLATGAAGVLIGIGRRNEARALDQLGWSRSLRTGVYAFNALLLALPGGVLASAFIILASWFWPGNMPLSTMWILLASGVIIYGVSLVSMACMIPHGKRFRGGSHVVMRAAQAPSPIVPTSPAPTKALHKVSSRGGRGGDRWWGRLRCPRPFKHTSDAAFHVHITAPLVCGIAITATIFLIAIEYLMVSGLNRELVVTVLGNQVRVALEGAQVLLVVLVLITALLTVGLCTSLLLRGRRDELALLAKVGWEQRHVLLRLLRESWRTGALSGAVGALLALGVIAVAGSLPPLWAMSSVLAGGPLLGVLLASLVVYTLARRELSSVYLERA